MAIGDITRINTNIGAFNALNSLRSIGQQLSASQLRLQTGKRINQASDDPAGFSIASKLTSRSRGLAVALDSVGTSINMFSIAEGSMQAIHDDLLDIRDLVLKATSDNMGTTERQTLDKRIADLTDEVTRLRNSTSFNGLNLLDGTFTNKNVLTGSETTDVSTVSISQDFSLASLGVTTASLAVDTVANASISLSRIDAALTSVRTSIQTVGSMSGRLQTMQANISSAITNTEAAKSRIMDADVAAEQVNSVRLQILQQLATAQLAQANSSPMQIMALFR